MKKALAIFLLFMATTHATAAQHDDVRREVTAGRFKPLADILSVVQRKYAGDVLDVELDRNDQGRHIYEVRLLGGNGERREIHIDAVTGEEVANEAEPLLADLPRLLRKVLEVYPGRVVDVDLTRERGGKKSYQIRVLQNDGQIRGVFIDALTGERFSDVGALQPVPGMKPLSDLLEALQRRYSGTVHEAELKYDRNEQPFYEIDLQLADGRLIEVSMDPVTGRVLSEDEIEVR